MSKSQITNHKSQNFDRLYLLLDPGSEDGRLRFFVLGALGETVAHYAFEAHRKAIELMLAMIEKKLKEIKRSLKDIKGILVMRGGESFSAVRGVHAIANALSWSLRIPSTSINATSLCHSREIGNPEKTKKQTILNAIRILNRQKAFTLLLPAYSRPPNITVARGTSSVVR